MPKANHYIVNKNEEDIYNGHGFKYKNYDKIPNTIFNIHLIYAYFNTFIIVSNWKICCFS